MGTSYVEEAILKVKDRSTKPLRSVNKEILNVLRSAEKLGRISFNPRGLPEAQRNLNSYGNTLKSLSRIKTVSTRVSLPGVAQAKTKVDNLRKSIRSIPSSKSTSISVNRRGDGGTGTNSPPPGVGQRPRVVGINVLPLRNVLRDGARRLAFSIEQALINGFARGASQQDIADTRLNIQNLNPEQRAGAEQVGREIREQSPSFTRGEALNLSSELILVTRNNIQAASQLGALVSDFAELQQALGEARQDAVDNAFLLAKVGEQQGAFSDAQGDFDRSGAEQFFNLMKLGFIQLGREATPQLIATLNKSLRTSKLSLDDRGQFTALLLAEEQGSTAGVGLNQLIKQLSGINVTQKALRAQQEFGLTNITEVNVGTVGGRRSTQLQGESLDNDLLRRDPLGWVNRYVIPAMRRAGLDPNDAVDVTEFASRIVSRNTAQESAAALILRSAELTKATDAGLARTGGDIEGAKEESLLLTFNETKSAFISLLGDVSDSLENVFIPVLTTVRDTVNSFSDFIRGPDGEGSALRTGAVIGGGLATAGATVALGIAITKAMFPFGKNVALNTASVTFNTAAINRLTAAMSLSGGGMLGGSKKSPRAGNSFSNKASRAGNAVKGAAAVAAGIFKKITLNPATIGAVAAFTPSAAEAGTLNDEQFEKLQLKDEDREVLKNFAGPGNLLRSPSGSDLSNDVNKEFQQLQREKLALPENQARMEGLMQEIERIKKNINNPMVGESGREALRARHGEVVGQLGAIGVDQATLDVLVQSLNAAPSELEMAFGDGMARAQEIGPMIGSAGQAMATALQQALMGVAPEVGQAMASSLKTAAAGIKVGVSGSNQVGSPSAPALDTGSSQPQ